LKGFGDKYGLLIRGPAGVGKSCLAGKLIERCVEKELIVVRGAVKKVDVLQKLRQMFDRTGISSGLDIIKSEEEFDEKIKALFRGPLQEQPTVLYFDDFEQNLVLQRDFLSDFLTNHPSAPGSAGDGTDRRRGSASAYIARALRPLAA
jgi:GTPase SAR1 family protein